MCILKYEVDSDDVTFHFTQAGKAALIPGNRLNDCNKSDPQRTTVPLSSTEHFSHCLTCIAPLLLSIICNR